MKLTLALLTLLTLSVAASAVLLIRKSTTALPVSPQSELAQGSSDRGPVRMVRFVLTEDGLYPRQMSVAPGLVNIALEDKTGVSDGLLLESIVGAERVRILKIARAEKHWRGRGLVKLAAGRYVISDASKPSHKAELAVGP